VHYKRLELLPFAMWPDFPAADYYGSSASTADIRVNSLGIPSVPSLVHMPDLNRAGEVAGRNLYPCVPQVDADTMVWLCSPHGSPLTAIHIRSRSAAAGIRVRKQRQHSAC
jgi:hypothetical protein